MRCPISESLLSAALLGALSLTGYAQQPPTRTPRTVSNFVRVTDQMMRAPKPEDWLMHRGNYQAWGRVRLRAAAIDMKYRRIVGDVDKESTRAPRIGALSPRPRVDSAARVRREKTRRSRHARV